MTLRKPSTRPLRLWPIAMSALFITLAIVFALGLTGRLAALLAVGILVPVTVWVVFELRAERAAHEAALTRWDASEAVFAERLRIARDLHDIVSHGLGMITVRAATARHINAQNASEPELLEAIEDVETLSRQATIELRRMLETLREGDDPAPRHPTDSLASLPGIIAGAQRSGLGVKLHHEYLGPVSPGAQLAICAIVREGLDNCARHAGFTCVQVTLRREHDIISITITDDGPSTGWAAAPGAGHGLIGLRERVNSLGGTLYAGPHRTGFRLQATVPERIR